MKSPSAFLKLKLVLFTAHLSNAAGGFSRSIPGMARALDCLPGMEVHVVGVRDRRSRDSWQGWAPRVHAHWERGPRSFHWAPAMGATLAALHPDVVDSQGVWMHQSLVNLRHHRRTGCPYLVTPRGMLDPWSLQRSGWKKRLVARWFENEHLRQSACLRALNHDEARAFRAYGLRNPIAIVPNGVDLPDRPAEAPQQSRTILFLGRVDPKKGIADLLRAWALAALSAASWRLQITGWGDPAYVAAMQELARELDLERRVTFTGPLFGEAKARAFRNAAAFVLPSFSEGLPMAVLEAWSYGLPVLMTRECNLPEGFAVGAAVHIETHPEAMAKSLAAFMTSPASERRAMGDAGRRLVEDRFTWDRVAAEMHEVYTWVLGGGPPPACVMTD
jgi:glycosyltransferase involved in cell wall biosynthesis